jgi:hypothetical protein
MEKYEIFENSKRRNRKFNFQCDGKIDRIRVQVASGSGSASPLLETFSTFLFSPRYDLSMVTGFLLYCASAVGGQYMFKVNFFIS